MSANRKTSQKALHLPASPLESTHTPATGQALILQNGRTASKVCATIVTSPRTAKRDNKTVM